MTRPVPELFDLIAGRPVDPGPGLVASAIEHRLGGLLFSAVEAGQVELGPEDRRTLAVADLATGRHHLQLWDGLLNLLAVLDEIGVDAISIKGVAEEARLFDRVGERPCSDLDVVIAPHHLARIDRVLGRIGVAYRPLSDLESLIRRRQLQHLHLDWQGVALDVHLDPLKLGIWTRQTDLVTGTATTVRGPDGSSVAVLAPELALVAFLLHLNKDRFAYLGAHVDIARLLAHVDLDWDLVVRFVEGEGLMIPVWKSLRAVAEALALDVDIPPVAGWRSELWDRLWPPSSRLLGHDGRFASRHRQRALPLLTTGRWTDVAREARRGLLPPRALLDYHQPSLRDHGRIRRLTVDRLSAIRRI